MLVIGHRESAPNGELVDTIPVKTSSGLGITTIFHVPVPDVAAGDILVVTAKAQVTNNLHKPPVSTTQNNVGVGCSLGFVDALGGLYPVTFWAGGNVDARVHHATRLDMASYVVPPGVAGACAVRFWLMASALQAKANWTLRVDRGYGHLRVLHLRG